MVVRARLSTAEMIVKYSRSILAALMVSKSTPNAGNLEVKVFRFFAMSKTAMIAVALR